MYAVWDCTNSNIHHFVFPVQFLNAGDTFTGTVHFDSCSDVEDHPGAIIVTKSAGNLVSVIVVTKLMGQVRSYKADGVFHVASRKWILSPVDRDSKSLGLVCTFLTTENSAECTLQKDNFAVDCGTFNIQRDHIGN